MLFLTPAQASQLRCRILYDLQTDAYVEIDTRFIKSLFGSLTELRRWCESWSLKYEIFTRPEMLRSDRKTPIEWVSFSYPEPDIVIVT